MPMKEFVCGRLIGRCGVAKSGLWKCTTDRNIEHTHIFSIMKITKNGNNALAIYIGPLSFIAGIINR